MWRLVKATSNSQYTVRRTFPFQRNLSFAIIINIGYCQGAVNKSIEVVSEILAATAIAAADSITATSGIPVQVGNLGVSNFSVINSSGTLRTFEAYVKNYMAVSMTNVSWSLNTGNGIVSSTSPITLQPQESAFIFVQYNYTATGTFTANFTAVNGSWNDLEALNVTIT